MDKERGDEDINGEWTVLFISAPACTLSSWSSHGKGKGELVPYLSQLKGTSRELSRVHGLYALTVRECIDWSLTHIWKCLLAGGSARVHTGSWVMRWGHFGNSPDSGWAGMSGVSHWQDKAPWLGTELRGPPRRADDPSEGMNGSWAEGKGIGFSQRRQSQETSSGMGKVCEEPTNAPARQMPMISHSYLE